MSIWQDSSGKILHASGSILECAECPCDPGGCPCSAWPASPTPADFPCGGLEFSYLISSPGEFVENSWDTETCGVGMQLPISSWIESAPHAVGATTTPCGWEFYDYDLNQGISLERLPNGNWSVRFSQSNYGVLYGYYLKVGGSTPIGTYTRVDGCYLDGIGYSYRIDNAAATVEVTDVP